MATPIQAPKVTDSIEFEFDYSGHLNLLNDLVERIAVASETIANKITLIEQHQNVLQSTVENHSSYCTSGPHMRTLGAACEDPQSLTRAIAIYNMRVTDILEEIRQEMKNPTPFP
jgi:hypothetical protein